MNYTVDRTRWSKLTIFEQMGNIYSEVGRTFKAKLSGQKEDSLQASIRAIDLFDSTVAAQIGAHPARAREILRAKEQFLEAYYGDASRSDMQKLENYFMQFAVAARSQR